LLGANASQGTSCICGADHSESIGLDIREALLPSYKDTGKAPTPTKPPLYQQSSQDLSRKDSRKGTDVGEAASAFASPSRHEVGLAINGTRSALQSMARDRPCNVQWHGVGVGLFGEGIDKYSIPKTFLACETKSLWM
jgi:hypothetical protein